jgi:predicted nucleotidyltransferase
MMTEIDFDIDIEACRRNLQALDQQRFQEREERRLAARSAILTALRELLPNHPEARRVYLFGSVTRQGYFHPGSDVDLAIEGLNPEQYFELWHELSEAAPGCFIDLRDISEESHRPGIKSTALLR